MTHELPHSAEATRDVTVPASYLRTLLRAVSEQGHDVEAFAAAEGIDLTALANETGVSASRFGRAYQRAMWLLEDESLGMVSGGRVVRGTFRMMCLSVVHCSTLGDVVTRAGEFFDVCQGASVKPQLVDEAHVARIGFAAVRRVATQPVEQILHAEGVVRVRTSLYVWSSLLAWFAGRAMPLEAVHFTFEQPPRGELWTDLFGCPVHFEQSESGLILDSGVMKWPNVQDESSLSMFLKAAPYRLIAPAFHDKSLRERVLSLFGNDFSRPMPTAAQAGRLLGMSVSTLRRRLEDEGTSYQALKDESRRAAAISYLANARLSLGDIAQLLGFDEPSAFFRTFRRWTGTTPSRYRTQLTNSDTQE